MVLRNQAVLEIDGHGTTAVFEFRDGFELSRNIDKSYIISERGQFLREITNLSSDIDSVPDVESDAFRRTGINVDGGSGTWARTASFVTGAEADDLQWGDGSSNPERDASGPNANRHDRADVLEYWIATTRSDSQGQCRLYYNQWNDGTHGAAGGHNRPMYVAILSAQINAGDDPSFVEGTIEMLHTALSPTDNRGATELLEDIFGDA